MISAKPENAMSPLTPIPTAVEPRGRLAPPVRCLLCDIYGTLLISGSGDIGVSQKLAPPFAKIGRLLARHGIQMDAEALLQELHAAIRARHAEARTAGIDVPEVRIDEVWAGILGYETTEAARTALDLARRKKSE